MVATYPGSALLPGRQASGWRRSGEVELVRAAAEQVEHAQHDLVGIIGGELWLGRLGLAIIFEDAAERFIFMPDHGEQQRERGKAHHAAGNGGKHARPPAAAHPQAPHIGQMPPHDLHRPFRHHRIGPPPRLRTHLLLHLDERGQMLAKVNADIGLGNGHGAAPVGSDEMRATGEDRGGWWGGEKCICACLFGVNRIR